MKESYCINDKRVTPNMEPSGYKKDKRGRTQFFCRCGDCGNKKVSYVKMMEVPPNIVTSDYNYYINMKESYCINDKKVTPCVEPMGYTKDKRGRTQFFCRCGDCGNKKVSYVKMGGVPPNIVTSDYNFIRCL